MTEEEIAEVKATSENEEGLIFADKIIVDLTSKTSKISMYDNKQVRAKILK